LCLQSPSTQASAASWSAATAENFLIVANAATLSCPWSGGGDPLSMDGTDISVFSVKQGRLGVVAVTRLA